MPEVLRWGGPCTFYFCIWSQSHLPLAWNLCLCLCVSRVCGCFFPVRSRKVGGALWLLDALWSQLAPGYISPFRFWHICIRCIDCWLGHICGWSLGEWYRVLSWDIRPSSLDFSGRSSSHLQWGTSYLVWKGRCYNGVWPFSNLMWGWILGHHMKVYPLPLWSTLYNLRSSQVWCRILCGFM